MIWAVMYLSGWTLQLGLHCYAHNKGQRSEQTKIRSEQLQSEVDDFCTSLQRTCAEMAYLQHMLQCRVWQLGSKDSQQREGSVAHCTVCSLLGTLHNQAHVHGLQPGV